MSYEAKIIADSISPDEDRLTTQEVTFPRMVLAEFNTHRVFSRNSASSRAIPVEKQLNRILDGPFLPIYWGINQPGMQAFDELSKDEQQEAEAIWLEQRDTAVLGACALTGGVSYLKDKTLQERISALDGIHKYGLKTKQLKRPIHKQIANRLLEPFMWHTVVVTSSEWDNFYALRVNPQAQPEIQKAANMMLNVYNESQPKTVDYGEFHLPFIQEDEMDLPTLQKVKIAVGRCARVSYLTHDGIRDPQKDIELGEILAEHGHMSPLEHVATPMTKEERAGNEFSGNFRGWTQYRKTIPNEDNYANVLKQINNE